MLENLTKRGLSALLVLVMVLSMVPFSAFATEDGAQSDLDSVIAQSDTEPADETEPATEPEEQAEVEETFPNTEDDGHQHNSVVSERIPALCEDDGRTSGTYCSLCGVTLSGREVITALGHNIEQHEAKLPTFSKVGWQAYEDCTRCGYTTYIEIPKLETPVIEDYETFMLALFYLEELANAYVLENPGKDPLELMIKYIRTGVDRYNSGSWGIMAGYEDADFAKFVADVEDMLNSEVSSIEEMFCISSLKNIENFYLPNGELADIGHMFGTMDITYHNNFGVNHADVGGWAGDLVDLLEFSDYSGISGTLDEMIAQIEEKTFLFTAPEGVGGFNALDLNGDLDAMYLMDQLKKEGYHYEYEVSGLAMNLMMYFTEDLTLKDRADYFLKNRLDGISTRNGIRDAVYNAYTTNKVITTLEGTREFQSSDLETLRKAVCYTYADFICRLAGDYVESGENKLFTVFSSESANLAPGINQQIKMATTADGKQIVYYLATADLTRDDVSLYANYHNNDPTQGWEMQRVEDQALAAEQRHSDPNSEHYIENYNVIAAVNGSGFNMSTGEPSGVLVMEGVEYQPISSAGFVGILKDGTPVFGTKEEYENIYKGQVQEAIACFGSRLIKDGKIVEGLDDTRAPRTAIGFTKTGKVVLLVLDGRQEPFSAGGGYQTLAQILLEAGCVEATNLDGGGSTTFVVQQPGDESLSVVNKPSDGFARSVSTSWILVSTAPSSTAFDHAVIDSEYDYMSVGTSLQMTAVGISPSGNTVALPENVSWAVSNEEIGSITADGVFTAMQNGDVEVLMMLDGIVVGSKTMHIVLPDNLYFTKTNMETVYGETKVLPLKALYMGKEVLAVPADFTFTLSNNKAGSINGISFVSTSNENAGVNSVTVTASLTANPGATASIMISLYKQGELTFDFDQATGGDRQLAWYRDVSNSITDDNSVYTIVTAGQDMVTSYILAIDMTQIPIPERLEELTYMLPGSDIEGANAWTFLCQLAERISVLSEIKAVVNYDPNFTLDISELQLINQYFVLSDVAVDEENSTLTLTLNWKKQTQAIAIDSANPMCIVNGLKLIPKADAQWDSKNQLNAINTGNISYKIYMRASALYSFSSKPENQAIFGLYDYVNPNDSYDKGGYFQDTYKEFYDSYTLVNRVKEGWYNEEGGFTYYIAGEKITGVQKVEGLYYNFGENGVLATKNPYTGLFVEDGNTYYAKLGEPVKGWQSVGEDWYLFNWQTGVGINGSYDDRIDGVPVVYEFENGRLTKGYWHRDENGLRYFYGPYYYKQGWKTIDGEQCFFEDYYAATGIFPVRVALTKVTTWCEFTEGGALIGNAPDGLYWFRDQKYYVVDATTQTSGLYEVDGAYYYANSDGTLKVDTVCWISYTRGVIPAGMYRFDAEGKIIMTTELVDENGTLYYYKNGARTANAGLVEYQGDIYLIGDGAMITKNITRWVSKTNGLRPAGVYTFDAEGKMVIYNGIVDGYYYVDGAKTNAGMLLIDGNYYFATSGGKLKTSEVSWCSYNNGLLPAGIYRFAADGKIIMTAELVDENGTLYYYKDGRRTSSAGLVEYNGDIYLVGDGAMVTKNITRWVNRTNGLKPVGEYTFDADGKMVIYNGIVDGYYYVDGIKTSAGMLLIDGNYYFATSGGKLKANESSWCSYNNGLLPAGVYRFDAEGKIIMTTELVDEDGTLYYYKNGARTSNAGMVEYQGDIYLVGDGAMVTKNITRWVNKTNGLLPAGEYTFDEDGKLVK
ncbi:MAG: phosphodiester glycosidase family protein [Oscillospiraceae bacterium]|nr:phosphodiester glycosidase family protein [Oscillospiraceae bacterium]